MPNTITDNLQRLVDAKTAIANAITAKGGTVTTGDGFEAFPADIVSIPTGTEIEGAVMYTNTGYHKKIFFGDDGEQYRSAIKSIVFPDGVTSIADYAFGSCYNLEAIVIPYGVTSIGAGAFGGCSGLKTVVIPVTVTSIHSSAFGGCSNITFVINRTTGGINGYPWGATNANVIWTG